jgi:hypothetical protein
VLGTIMLHAEPWADAIKRYPQVNLVTVTRTSYQHALDDLRYWLQTKNPAIIASPQKS